MPKNQFGDDVLTNQFGDPVVAAEQTPAEKPGLLDRFDSWMHEPVTWGNGAAQAQPRQIMTVDDAGNSYGLTPEQQSEADNKLAEFAMRVGTPLAAAGLAPVTGGASLGLAGAGAFTGEVLAQQHEMARGARDKASYGQMVAAPLVAAIPLGPATGGAMFVKGELAAARPLAPLVRGAVGGLAGGAGSIAQQHIDNGQINWGDVASSAAFGTLFGAGLGGMETLQATEAQKAAILAFRKRTGNWQGTDMEFIDWLRQQAGHGPVAPNVPSEEGASVSSEQIQAPAEPAPVPTGEPSAISPTPVVNSFGDPVVGGAPSMVSPQPSPTAQPPAPAPATAPAAIAPAVELPPEPVAAPAQAQPQVSLTEPAQAAVGGQAPAPESVAQAGVGQPPEAPAPAPVAAVAPTPSLDREVSQLVDRKQFKVQREYLLNTANKLLEAAPASGSGQVVIKVPGDGTYTIENSQPALQRFADNVDKRFGKSFRVKLDNSGLGDAYATITSPFNEGNVASRKAGPASPIPAIKTNPTPADLSKAVGLAAVTDKALIRPALEHVLSDSGYAVATDGRRLFIATGGVGKTPEQIAAAAGTNFPNWRQVVPPWVKLENGTIRVTKTAPTKPLLVDTASAIKAINQVRGVLGEKSNAVALYDLGGGKIGFSGQSPDVGDYQSEGVQDGMISKAPVNPDYLHDVMVAARQAGHTHVKVYFSADNGPVVAVGGDNFAAITMPVSGKIVAGEQQNPAKSAPTPADVSAKPTAGAAASPGFAGTPPVEGIAPPRPQPADDPAFSQLPLQLPEMVQFYRMLSGGKNPRIVEQINALHGQAAGVFRYLEGNVDSGRIELRADLFHLLSQAEKNKLLRDAVTWATLMKQANPEMNFQEAVRHRFEKLVKEAEADAMKRDPLRAMAVFAHEIGHFVDFLPHATLERGNVLGHMASLKGHLSHFIGANPNVTATVPTTAERAALRRKAEQEVIKSVREITETIRREVPIYDEIKITPDHVTGIVKSLGRDEFPEFYDWFSSLDRATKVDVLRKAMKGIVDERAAQFGKRTQTGTQMVEETVTRQVGDASQEAISKRYEELLSEELKRRGLISLKDIKTELNGLIAWWHSRDKIPAYFTTAKEMYAEAFSVLMNNPAALAKRAPTWWRAFNEYLVRKPAIQKLWDQVQNDIKSGVIFAQRVHNLRDSWVKDEAAGLSLEKAQEKMTLRRLRDTMNLAFNKHQGPIQALARKQLGDPKAGHLLDSLKDYLYRQTDTEAFARQINMRVEKPLADNGLHHRDLDEFLFHSRIVAGDAQETANSQGWSPNTSAQRLDEMKNMMGPAAFGALQQASSQLRSIYEQGPVALLERSRTLSPELINKIKSNVHYAPFERARDAFNPHDLGTIRGMMTAAYGEGNTARIFQRIGSFQDIKSPYVALVKKAEVLTRFAYRQIATKAIRDFMLEHQPELIEQAPKKYNGSRLVPDDKLTPLVGTLYTMDDGEMNGWYVPRAIYETMQNSSGAIELMLVNAAMKVLMPFKAVLTELNPGFWATAFVKDIATGAMQMPHGIRANRNLFKAWKGARATYSGKPDAVADMMLKRLMVISRADPRGVHLGHPDEMDRWLLRMSKHPELWDAETKKVGLALRFWEAWKQQGQILERTVKATHMIELDRAYGSPAPTENMPWVTMPEAMKRKLVLEFAGSPDFAERGRAASVVEAFGKWMFFNPFLRGYESFYNAAKYDPKSFWLKFMSAAGMTAIAFYLYEKGHTNLGEDPRKAEESRAMLRSIPERDKLRGFVIPLDWVNRQQSKVAYILVPFPDQYRVANAALRKTLQSAFGDNSRVSGDGTLLQFAGQDLPGTNPLITWAGHWKDFAIDGRNPYDEFRGRPMLDDRVFKAGQGAGQLAKQMASDLQGGIGYRFYPDIPGETKSSTEKFLQTPFISNLVGRWVRVSNAGVHEDDSRATDPEEKYKAQLQLVAEEMMRKSMNGQPWTPAEIQLTSVQPYIQSYMQERSRAMMATAIGPEAQDFQRADSAGKQALMNLWSQRLQERNARLQGTGKH